MGACAKFQKKIIGRVTPMAACDQFQRNAPSENFKYEIKSMNQLTRHTYDSMRSRHLALHVVS
jgi:hypothetical protein